MNEYSIAQNGATEFQILRLVGEIYYVIGTAVNRDYAEQIVSALNPPTEIRRSWDDLAR